MNASVDRVDEANDVQELTEVVASPASVQTDIVIIGAGPAGLFAAFQAGVLGMSCEVLEATHRPGGQCVELYPAKPIYDIPAIASCTGQELADRLAAQAVSLGAKIHYNSAASTLVQLHDGRWRIGTSLGVHYDAAAVLVAAGNGAFTPQRLAVAVDPALEEQQVHYAVRNVARFADTRVVIAGGGDSALDWALALKSTARVTVLHRRSVFSAAAATADAVREAAQRGELEIVTGTVQALKSGADGRLCAIDVLQQSGPLTLPCDHLIVLYGLVADLGDLNHWELANRAGRIAVDTSNYETSRPGIFALGDIALYPNKHKLILSAFHEAALGLRRAYRYVHPETPLVHVHTSNDGRLKAQIDKL